MKSPTDLCPCGSTKEFNNCCALYLINKQPAPSAEALMRSRYTAYTLLREEYLLATWHPSTRPLGLGLAEDTFTKWIGLEIRNHEQQDAAHATVEFVARYKVKGRAHRMHEVSRFVFEDDRWFYLDGLLTNTK